MFYVYAFNGEIEDYEMIGGFKDRRDAELCMAQSQSKSKTISEDPHLLKPKAAQPQDEHQG